MSPRSAAAAVVRNAATVHAPARTRARPAPTRRRSGAAARPRTQTRARPSRDFVSLLDRVLQGPAYIALVGVLLVGIVFFNVGVLQLNHGIAGTDVRATQLERQNAALTQQLAKLASSERIQRLAIQQGLVLPQPGDVRYLRANPNDAARALRVMSAPAPSTGAALISQASQTPPATTTPATTSTAPPVTAQATTATATQPAATP